MAFLTAPTFGDVDVTIQNGASIEYIAVGDEGMALDGSALDTVRAYKRRIPLMTTPLSSTDCDSLYSAITAAGPLTFSGDVLGGSVSCFVRVTKRSPVAIAGGQRWCLEFTIREA